MAINWYPGHMKKARREIGKAMSQVDFVVELLDARIPYSSETPLVASLRRDKPSLKILNKADLADPAVTKLWLAHLQRERGVKAVAMNWKETKRIRGLMEQGRRLLPADRNKGRPVTAMILGVPNVGKSTMINTLRGKAVARTGDVPAITKGQQKVKLSNDLTLLDTPGFLWPRLYPAECGYRLAVTGAIRDTAIDYQDVALFAAEFLRTRYPEATMARYKLKALPESREALLAAVGSKRGCLQKGGVLDMHRASEVLLYELRQGMIGPLSLETPADIPSKAEEAEEAEEAEPEATEGEEPTEAGEA